VVSISEAANPGSISSFTLRAWLALSMHPVAAGWKMTIMDDPGHPACH
jgi:hypothetical protein